MLYSKRRELTFGLREGTRERKKVGTQREIMDIERERKRESKNPAWV